MTLIHSTSPEFGWNLDAFGRQRVSETGNRSDAEFLYDAMPMVFDDISVGSGTATFRPTQRDVLIGLNSGPTGTQAGLRHHAWVPYTPGSSQLTEITGVPNYGNTSSGTMYIFLRSSVSGTTYVEQYDQSQWEDLTTGQDWSKSHIFAVDFQSLKVGRIRYGMVVSGEPVQVAAIENDNLRDTGYWQYASLPPYWKLYNENGQTVAELGYGDEFNGCGFRYVWNNIQPTAKMTAICETVKSEGGVDLLQMPGFPFSASNKQTTISVGATIIPVLSIQVKTTFNSLVNRILVVPTALSIYNDNPIYWEIRLNPTLTTPSWVSVDANSATNYDVSSTSISGGRILASGYAGAGGGKASSTDRGFTDKVPLALDAAGTTGDILTFCAGRVGSISAATGAAIDFKEIR